MKVLLGLGILGAAGVAVYLLWLGKPKAEVVNLVRDLPVVQVVRLEAVDRIMQVPSQGVVEARKVSQVAAELAGRVVSVSEKFDKGGEFKEGDILVEIDDADYKAAEAQAKATLAEKKLALETEEARAAQAKRDWENLGRTGVAKDLTLRKPQLASAQARYKAAEAALKKAERDLSKTKIRTPFAGRIRQAKTEKGAYLMPGSPVVDYYTTEPYELRMPVSLDELQYVKNIDQGGRGARVEIDTMAGGILYSWKGEVTRNEYEVERESRSIYLVALMEGESEGEGVRLQPGLFVQASIEGETLKGCFEVPMKAFLDLDRVLVVEEGKTAVNREGKIRIRKVKVVRREGDKAIVDGGLKSGDIICLTALPDVIDGMGVRIVAGDNEEESKKTTPLP